jgi:cell fate regulator YaaT (PSP1 superfamily)
MESKIVSVRFNPMGKAYHFDAAKVADIRKGDYVIVETARGWQLGQVIDFPKGSSQPGDGSVKMIDRIATPRDLAIRQSWQQKEADAADKTRERVKGLNLRGIKIIMAEYSFDGSRLSISFSTESEEKAELKSLRQDMQKVFSPAQVDLRQIGPRDVAKIYSGIGACGLEKRCCAGFLTEFSSISIRMAKEQGISLTPSEITGMCGRLRCCLNYEYSQYCEMRQELPRKNKKVMTPAGEGKVVDIMTLRQRIIVELPEVGRREYSKEEVTIIEETASAEQNVKSPNQPEHIQKPAEDTGQNQRPRRSGYKGNRPNRNKPENTH